MEDHSVHSPVSCEGRSTQFATQYRPVVSWVGSHRILFGLAGHKERIISSVAIQNRFERKITRLSRRFLPHSARKVLRNILPRKVRDDLWWNLADVTLVSFPKSGRTWLRLMIGRVLQQHFGTELDDSLLELERLADRDSRIPRIHAAHDGVGSWRDPREYRGRRVILLVRDPRDVVVSYYYQLRYRMDQFDGTLDEFVTDPARDRYDPPFLRHVGEWSAEHE